MLLTQSVTSEVLLDEMFDYLIAVTVSSLAHTAMSLRTHNLETEPRTTAEAFKTDLM